MSLYHAYFDESGCDEGSRLLAVGGYVVQSAKAQEMDRRWRVVLESYSLPHFHMVDCAHGNGAFAPLSLAQRVAVEKAMIRLIKGYTTMGFVALVNPKRFEERDELRGADPYTFCVDLCVKGLCSALITGRDRVLSPKVAFFVESGHQNRSRAHAELTRWSRTPDGVKYYAAHTFAKKEDIRLLQAADLLVWQSAKFMKDKLSQTRPPRRDFLSLMKHKHAFAYAVLHDNILSQSFDDYPHIEDPFRDGYLRAVFSDTHDSDDIVNLYHLIGLERNMRGTIEL